MTESEARRRCTELNEAATEPGVRWLAKQKAPGEWSAVRVRVPGVKATGPLVTSQETPRGPDPSDPRPLVNPNWGVG
ncbi:MAG: hypothetical protein QOJ35_1732 [Solirubrobacteraceae bacterium]|jgi:hypothetical protein|nr:hypothetical protein [Solirubrobacteraceae bacterium]